MANNQQSITENGLLKIKFKSMSRDQENMQFSLSKGYKSPFATFIIHQAINFVVKG